MAVRAEKPRRRAREWAGRPEGDRPARPAASGSRATLGKGQIGGAAARVCVARGSGWLLSAVDPRPDEARWFGAPSGGGGRGERASLLVRRPFESLSPVTSQCPGGQYSQRGGK